MNKKTTVIIIDDEQEARDVLIRLLQKFPKIEIIDQLADVDSGIVSFLKSKPNIVFLDVQMPKKDGFAFIDHLQDYLIDTTIIFITAYHKYAIEAIKHSAFDFLLKPINQNELSRTINRYKETKSKNNLQLDIQNLLTNLDNHKKIKLNTRNGFELIKPEDIIYLEADNNYTTIYCTLEKKTVSSLNLKKLEDILQKYHFFLKISRSIIINTNYLSTFDRTNKRCILFTNSKTYNLKVSREKVKDFDRLI